MFIVHRARCGSIRPGAQQWPAGAFTERDYRKVVADDLQALAEAHVA